MGDLFDAVYYGRLNEVYKCIFEEVDVNAFNQVGNQSIHAASHNGDVRIAELLLRAGAKVNSKGRAGNTPLHYACSKKRVAMVQFLLESGADPTVKNLKGKTPKDLCLASTEPSQEGQDEKEIEKLLDAWIIKRCSFLSSAKTPEETKRNERHQDDQQPSVLDAVKPLIIDARAKQTRKKFSLGENRTNSSQPALEPTVETSPKPVEQQHVDEEEENQEPDSPEPATTEQATTEQTKGGYYVEIDGKQIFISEYQSEEEEEEDEEENEEEEEEGDEDDSQQQMVREASKDKTLKFSLSPGPVGLGMQLEESGRFTRVSDLHPQGPAAMEGVLIGDALLSVNGTSTEGMLLNAVKQLLAAESQLNEELDLVFSRLP